jgi:hypothetical protein
MSDMPGGSSYFHGNSDPDITMNGGSTELWQTPHDANTLNDDTMHGGTEHWQAQHDANTSAVVVARQDMVMNPAVNSSRVWADEERPRINEVSR